MSCYETELNFPLGFIENIDEFQKRNNIYGANWRGVYSDSSFDLMWKYAVFITEYEDWYANCLLRN